MRYLIVILILMSFACKKFEKCETIYNGGDIYDCCGQGIGAQKEICDCIEKYNKDNQTFFESVNCK